ncbi:MAG TPA: acetyl-CoA carboxylase carboxyltransferase subunit alpha [Candidatus Omnitrophota bacterium]|nr:acetyl-CoA carboxylase carboxyltransferase subunit alpha [Candidatus Omnitrophota bacterium]HOX09532.1 acetyl-CoA carboxylase carboxyltransferase subunit alpha [Candidatus Omnitrophota bacterium]HRZ67541.1 acetyl-CoA carboxylase carboxyltransferase subunit alpha [Candidatus Omnitrophota bacterium]
MNGTGLDFEKPILELERKIEELKKFTSSENIDLSSEIKKLEDKLDKVKREVFESLSPWQRVQIARHPKRPYTLDYINLMMTDFCEVHGDRVFGDDKALICGFAKIDGQKVVVMGHQKGRDTKENLMRNFGSAHPEGYRKAMRLMHMGEKFNLPIVVFIDTPGAYPGIGAEERGQAEAIALNLMEMARLKVPIVCYIIGEGGSGGALGVGIGDRICVLENAYYSVISPEGCAAILWKDRTRAPDAAKALKLTAQDLFDLGLIDEVVREPLGGAHRDPARIAETIKESAKRHLKELSDMQPEDLVEARYEKYRKIGAFSTE